MFSDSLIKSPNGSLTATFLWLVFFLTVLVQFNSAAPAMGGVEFPGPVEQTLLAGPLSAVSVPWEDGNSEYLVVGDDLGYLSFVYHLFDDIHFNVFTRFPLGGDILWMERWQGGPFGQRGLVVATANPDRLHFLEINYSAPFVRIEQTIELSEDPGTGDFVSPGPDGEPQMVLSLPGVDQVLVLRQISGVWTINQTLDTGDEPWALAAIDLDGDQVLEFVSADRGDLSGTLGVFGRQNDGSYILQYHSELPGRVRQIRADDFNLDGVQELVVSYSDISRLDIMTWETGQWHTNHSLSGSLPADYFQITILPNGDFSIVTSVEDRGMMDFFQFTEGTWVHKDSYYVGCRPRALVACDLNGDEINEIVALGYSENLVSILLGNTAPGFWGFPAVALPQNTGPAILADFDGDGLSDLVVGTLAPNILSLYPRRVNGGLSSSSIQQDIGFFPASLAAGNFSGDDANELIALDATADNLTIYTFDNGTGFVSQSIIPYSSAFSQLHVSDIDNDGLMDVFLAQSGRQQVDILFGQGEGSFAPLLSLDFPLGTYDVAALDLNHDSLLDLVVTDGQSRVWTVLNQDGRSFGNPVANLANSQPRSIGIADLDGDSDLDIVVGNFFSATLTFLENSGDGTLNRRIGGLSLEGQPVSVECRDMNGDDIPDVVVRMLGEKELGMALASHVWDYPYVASFETSGGVVSTLVDDFNLDGQLDVLNLDTELQLGLVMHNTQRVLVSVDPVALTLECNNDEFHVRILPDRTGPWELSLGKQGQWQMLVSNGQNQVGSLDFDGRAWDLNFTPADLTTLDPSLQLRLTVGMGGDEESLFLDLSSHCFGSSAAIPRLRWQDQPWPNPFNPRIQCRIQLDNPGEVDAAVFDLAGHRVATLLQGYLSAGVHSLNWDGRRKGETSAAGLYLLRIRSENAVLSRKIILLK